MQVEKFNVHSLSVGQILGLIKAKEIAIPEIQRPFVWKKKQVRDLMDSLYKGFPTGYLIIWKNPNVRLKDGTTSSGKKTLIDGQQRVTALMTSLMGEAIVNNEYKKEVIKIAFDPYAALSGDKDAELFAVQDQSHLKSKKYITDISVLFQDDFSTFGFIKQFCADNPDMPDEALNDIVMNLRAISNRMIGVIELEDSLDIDVVTEIFIRINSKGSALSQGDFVMSKIASDTEHNGSILRKAIDYFAHMAIYPQFYQQISDKDEEFCQSEYFGKISWLKDDNETVFDPTCDDIIRIAFMNQYPRAKLADLVGLLSGRDFQTKEYRQEIVDDTFAKLRIGLLNVFNEYNFKQFIATIKGAGFISQKQINSQMALDFAYMLYLRLSKDGTSPSLVKKLVQRWYVFSVLTGRYTGSPESQFYTDLRLITEFGVEQALQNMEDARLSENFWNTEVPQNLAYASTINPTYLVFLAAQISLHENSLLSNNLSIGDLIDTVGDVHHIFPKEYLKANGVDKNQYNQVANYALLDSQVNKSIGKKSPKEYFTIAFQQCESGVAECGSILDKLSLEQNLRSNCIPEDIAFMDFQDYPRFLEERRLLMAKKIRSYYESL